MTDEKKRLLPPGYRIRELLPKGEGKLIKASCESLAGGFPEAEAGRIPLRIFPGAKMVRVGIAQDDGLRRIVTLKGLARSALAAGAVLLSDDWPISEGREALFLHDGKKVPMGRAAVSGGPDPLFNDDGISGPVRCKASGAFFAVTFPDPYPLLPGADYVFVGEDGVKRTLTLLWPGRPTPDERRRLEDTAARRPNPHPGAKEVYGRILHVRGFVQIPSILADCGWKGASASGKWIVLDSKRPALERKVKKLASRPGGADARVLRIPNIPDGLVLSLAAAMAERGDLVEREGWFFPPGDPPLSPFHRGWLGKVEEAGVDGVRQRSAASRADREALDALVRSGLAAGGENVWLSKEAYGEISAGILAGDSAGALISMAEARSRIACSRVVTMEVLVLMERDGILERSDDGDGRIVL